MFEPSNRKALKAELRRLDQLPISERVAAKFLLAKKEKEGGKEKLKGSDSEKGEGGRKRRRRSRSGSAMPERKK
eukprot:1399200-Alexandrium_andersonii.AAC.1